jgi:hypothetical protein
MTNRLVKEDRARREEMETAVCFIVNTCEYCKDAISPLEEMLSANLDDTI